MFLDDGEAVRAKAVNVRFPPGHALLAALGGFRGLQSDDPG